MGHPKLTPPSRAKMRCNVHVVASASFVARAHIVGHSLSPFLFLAFSFSLSLSLSLPPSFSHFLLQKLRSSTTKLYRSSTTELYRSSTNITNITAPLAHARILGPSCVCQGHRGCTKSYAGSLMGTSTWKTITRPLCVSQGNCGKRKKLHIYPEYLRAMGTKAIPGQKATKCQLEYHIGIQRGIDRRLYISEDHLFSCFFCFCSSTRVPLGELYVQKRPCASRALGKPVKSHFWSQ